VVDEDVEPAYEESEADTGADEPAAVEDSMETFAELQDGVNSIVDIGDGGDGFNFEMPEFDSDGSGSDGSDGSDSSGDSGSDGDFDFDFGSDGSDDGDADDDRTSTDADNSDATYKPDGIVPKRKPRKLNGKRVDPQSILDIAMANKTKLNNQSYKFDHGSSIISHARKFVQSDGRVALGNINLARSAKALINSLASVSLSDVTSAQTGGLVESSGILNVHAGERVVPEAQVSDRGPAPVEVNMDSDAIVSELRQLRQSVESDDARVSDRDLVRGLERLFDRHGGAV
jgi:hypothetical protein